MISGESMSRRLRLLAERLGWRAKKAVIVLPRSERDDEKDKRWADFNARLLADSDLRERLATDAELRARVNSYLNGTNDLDF